MRLQRQIVLVITLAFLLLFYTLNANAEVQKITHFSSRNFDLKVLTVESWEAAVGKNPKVPRTDEEILALARSIYPPLGAKPLAAERKKWHCGDMQVGRLFSALQNPVITDETREAVDRIIIQATPNLPEEYTSGRFIIHYTTTDADPLHNVTLADVEALASNLNANWTAYATNFTEPMHYHDGDQKDRIGIYVYYIDAETWGQTSSAWTYIDINSWILNIPCTRKITAAHELFHRVQFAYGLASAGDDWLVEGTATWVEKYRYPTEREYMDWMNSGLETPTKDLFTRDYDAVHLFVYLTERSTWRTIRAVWRNYQSQGAEVAFRLAVAANTGLVFEKFLRNWHTANYVKDLRYAPPKYDYAEDEVTKIDCTGDNYGPLASVPVIPQQYVVPSCITGSVGSYGANYVVFETPTNPEDLTIKIEGGADFLYRIIPIRGKSYLRVYGGDTNLFTFTRPSGTGKWTKVAVLVVGGASGGSYTITLGDKGCVKHGLKLMVGTPLLNNEPVQDGTPEWYVWAGAYAKTGCDNESGQNVEYNPCYECDLPPFQYDGCTVTGGGFLTVDAGTSVTYDASAYFDGGAFTSINVTNNNDATSIVFSLLGSTLADPTVIHCDPSLTQWNSDSISNIQAANTVIDITNAKDHPINLYISWDYTVDTTPRPDDGYTYESTFAADGAYRESYPCPSDPSFPYPNLLFSARCYFSLDCTDLSGSTMLQIDPGHVQHNFSLYLRSRSLSMGSDSYEHSPVPIAPSTSYSGTVTFRLEDPGP